MLQGLVLGLCLPRLQAGPASLVSLLQWQGHDLEAWAASTDYWNSSIIYSGGDDCAFKVWDTRQGVDAPAWANRKAHGAGVCCISSSPLQQHAVVTGSYDERARLWDLRMPSRPVQVTEVRGGRSGAQRGAALGRGVGQPCCHACCVQPGWMHVRVLLRLGAIPDPVRLGFGCGGVDCGGRRVHEFRLVAWGARGEGVWCDSAVGY